MFWYKNRPFYVYATGMEMVLDVYNDLYHADWGVQNI